MGNFKKLMNINEVVENVQTPQRLVKTDKKGKKLNKKDEVIGNAKIKCR